MLKTLFYNYLRAFMLPLENINQALPKKGIILELGCGEGVISSYLAKIPERKVTGIDINPYRLPKKKTKNLRFVKGDIRKLDSEKVHGVVISDVLHHINLKDQGIIIKSISRKIRKNGVLVIKEIDKKEFLKSQLSRFWDFILYPKEKIYYRDADSWKKLLESTDFKVKISRTNKLFPGSTTLFICVKK